MFNTNSSRARNNAIGFALSALFLCLLIWFDVAGFSSFLFETSFGWLVALVILVINGVLFGRVQMYLAAATFEDDDDDEDHHGGRRNPNLEPDHAVVRVPVDEPRGPF